MKPHIVFVSGISDAQLVTVEGVRGDGSLSYRTGGSCQLSAFLPNTGAFSRERVVIDTRPESAMVFRRLPDLIFNEIHEADSFGLSLRKLGRWLADEGRGLTCLNHPAQVLGTSRDRVSERLQGIDGLTVPLTLRIRPESPGDLLALIEASRLEFPLIIRECGSHSKSGMHLVESAGALRGLYALALDGREYYLIQYHEYAESGVYRQLRIFMIDGEACLRHVRYSDHWIVRARHSRAFMLAHPNLLDQEIGIMQSFEAGLGARLQPVLRRIHEVIGLDYYGLDCAVCPQGRLLVFECNAAMMALQNDRTTVDRYAPAMGRIQEALLRMLTRRAAAGARL